MYYAEQRWRDKPHPWISLGGKAVMVALILGVSGAVIMHYVWVGPATPGVPAQRDGNQGPLVPGPLDPTGGPLPGPAYTPGPSPMPSLTPPTCTGGGGSSVGMHVVLPMALGVVVGDGEQPSRQAGQEMAYSTGTMHLTSTSDEQSVCPVPTAHPLRRTTTHTYGTKRTPHTTTSGTARARSGSGRASLASPSPCPLQLKSGEPVVPPPAGDDGRATIPGVVSVEPERGG